jgi:hypothetical protein
MYYSVIVDCNSIAVYLNRSDCEGFEELLYVQCSRWEGMLGVSVRKMKALNVKMETVTVIGKGIWNLTCFV